MLLLGETLGEGSPCCRWGGVRSVGLVGAGGLCLTKRLRQRRRSCVMRCSRVSAGGVGIDVGVVGVEVVEGSVVGGEVALVVGGDGGNGVVICRRRLVNFFLQRRRSSAI